MNLKRRVFDYSAVLVLLVLPAAILHSHLKNPDHRNGFDRAVLRVTAPVERAVTWVLGGVVGTWQGYMAVVDVEDENAELRAENRRLRNELAMARRLAADSQVLAELVGLKERTKSETLAARVLSSSTTGNFRVVRIRLDRGQSEVRAGLAVLSPQGHFVGRIKDTFGQYSDVQLAVDPLSSVQVEVGQDASQGLLTGLGENDSYSCRVEHLDRGATIKVGDDVVTSGLGRLPEGIKVGTVTDVTTKDYHRFQEIEVAPAVDFGSLRHVLIVLAPPPPADPGADEKTVSPPHSRFAPY